LSQKESRKKIRTKLNKKPFVTRNSRQLW